MFSYVISHRCLLSQEQLNFSLPSCLAPSTSWHVSLSPAGSWSRQVSSPLCIAALGGFSMNTVIYHQRKGELEHSCLDKTGTLCLCSLSNTAQESFAVASLDTRIKAFEVLRKKASDVPGSYRLCKLVQPV